MRLEKISDYAKRVGVSVRTLKRRIKKGELKFERTSTGRIMIPVEDTRPDYTVVYTRVSSSENKDNLKSQSKRVQDFCEANGWVVKEVVEEVGNGLNDDRKKLKKLFHNKNITRIVVEHKDRLTRFGFNYISELWKDVEIVVINEVKEDETDLMQDFVSLVTSFCARLYGRRQTKRNTEKLIKELNS